MIQKEVEMSNISPDMYVGVEKKCNLYIDETNQFINENRGVIYQDYIDQRVQKGSEMIGEVRTLMKGLKEKSSELEKYEDILRKLEITVINLKKIGL